MSGPKDSGLTRREPAEADTLAVRDGAAPNYTSGTQIRHAAHACNCIGCCHKCGTCRTWPGHTADYCALVQRQARERLEALSAGVFQQDPA